MKEERINRAFSAFLALAPIIGIYASPIPGFNIAELILILFWILLLLIRKPLLPINAFSKQLLLFVFYIFLDYIVAALVNDTSNEVLFRTIRFSIYYLTVGFWVSEHLRMDIFWKWMRFVVYVAVAFLVFQYAAYYLGGRIILGFIPGLRVYQQIYETTDFVSKYSYYFRASSIFSEPAAMCQYFFIYLGYSLLNKDRLKLIDSIVSSAGIFLSTSGQGVIIGALLWIIYIIVNTFAGERKKTVRSLAMSFFMIIGISIVAVSISQTAVFSGVVDRLLNTGTQSARYARLNVYTYLFNDTNWFFTIFGRGFGSVPAEGVFVPALAYTLYGAGISGFLIMLRLMLESLIRSTKCGRAITLIFIFLFVIASTFMSLTGLLYLAVMHHEYNTFRNKGSEATYDGA